MKTLGCPTSQEKRPATRMTPVQAYLARVRMNPRAIMPPKKGKQNGKGHDEVSMSLFMHFDALKAAGEYKFALACATRIIMSYTRVTESTIRYFKEAAELYLALGQPDRTIAVVEGAVRKGAKNVTGCAATVYELLMIRVDALDLTNRGLQAMREYREAAAFAEKHRVKTRPRIPITSRRNKILPTRYALGR